MRKNTTLALLLLLTAFARAADGWKLALPGWTYEFPRDHRQHPEFKTEWWYFTGNLHDGQGRRFGYQLTFFRQGIRPPSARGAETSRFIVNDLKFAHFAISDAAGKRFHFGQKLSRGAFAEAGFDAAEKIAWIEDWTLVSDGARGFSLAAAHGGHRIELTLEQVKPWAIHGTEGVSPKAEGEGRASHYYSGTRMATSGTLTLAGKPLRVTGESWFDHEWATNQLTPAQVGWDWFSVQLDDGTELMLYQMRTRDGGTDATSSGTFVARDGTTQHLRREDYQLTPLKFWTSPETGGRYPIAWQLAVPKLDLTARIETPIERQELVLKPIAYWEGLIDVQATRAGRRVRGHGYMELTGYAGALVGLSSER